MYMLKQKFEPWESLPKPEQACLVLYLDAFARGQVILDFILLSEICLLPK
jgi:hypothetical protein